MRRLWLVRLGRNGEQEPHALEHTELVLGFHVGNLAGGHERAEAVEKVLTERLARDVRL